ncbi:MAG: alanine:cation symporter family protein [Flammeovirgaceae bacterium]|jgi:alanine or glycine:cation symporter, AGCS family|nr:alanine:cation symporter family protein [Flammeovirgaceae bacterium]|tara:strand:- start:4375 stop:5730 length:1356 start_codon:yes stop_codon:yes gene_type:complete
MKVIEQFFIDGANFVWGTPLLLLLLGGGFFFMLYSRFLPFKYFGHGLQVLSGKYNNDKDQGEISHFQALSGHLAATIGMGNISGVAVAIATGGPGALFWMWVSAFLGMATKFFTCSLAVMYRGKDSNGDLQGGPMYVITEGLGEKWKPLAIFFCMAGFFGATPVFQANQIIAAVNQIVLLPAGIEESLSLNLMMGILLMMLTAAVIFGGITRIGLWAGRLVPSMVILYVLSVGAILVMNASNIIPSFVLIVTDAFSANAVLGGAVGAIILAGARRAAFSNEAGIGTAPMMHGATKTEEPIREGLVAMLGPAIDTLLVCTLTGLCILVTGVWESSTASGISLTLEAFQMSLPGIGPYILAICVLVFAFTTVVGLSYYGRKCLSFLIGAKYGWYFNYWYVGIIIIGSVATLQSVVSLVDMAYGLMAFPTMISAVLLAPKVMQAATKYFKSLEL